MDASHCDVASPTWSDWHGIPWSDVHQVVGRLQARIAKAAKAGEWRNVKRLQKLLVRSTSAKALAVRRVTENRGRKTPGIDGQTWDTPTDKCQAIGTLQSAGYKPRPLRRVQIPKPNGGKRPLGIPTMRDRAMQGLHLLALDPVAETVGDVHSYGFRRERSTTDAIVQVRNALDRKASPKWVLEGDIKGCFDNISHDWLLRHVLMDRRILRKWLKAGYFEGGVLFPTERGTPQGGPISPVLANLALDGLQDALAGLFRTTRAARAAKVNFIRFADDFVVTGSSKELLENEVKPLIERFLRDRGLMLSETKTVITHVTTGFDFLGWHVRWDGDELTTRPSKKNLKNFLDKVRRTLRKERTANPRRVIEKLNPIISGWANYHRSQGISRTFAKADHLIWHALWRWACRRHPNKGKRWVKAKYFERIAGRDWRFTQPGQMLVTLADFPRRTHIKVDSQRNPYLPEDEQYFDARLARSMNSSLTGRRKLAWLWRWQDGACPECGEKITRETGWNIHHVIRRTEGGSNKLSNLRLLHPNCHRQLHANE
ncbi:MAG: group II intron reverse transcriptase/maturase [Burkholderiales bacterium]|nr:group II intron reverse transcriptase/maturase [Burkholderiales bacterium]